jgi:hypothetical protein
MQGRAGTAATTSSYIIWCVYVTIYLLPTSVHINMTIWLFDFFCLVSCPFHVHDMEHNLSATTYATDDYVAGDTVNTVTPRHQYPQQFSGSVRRCPSTYQGAVFPAGA